MTCSTASTAFAPATSPDDMLATREHIRAGEISVRRLARIRTDEPHISNVLGQTTADSKCCDVGPHAELLTICAAVERVAPTKKRARTRWEVRVRA